MEKENMKDNKIKDKNTNLYINMFYNIYSHGEKKVA